MTMFEQGLDTEESTGPSSVEVENRLLEDAIAEGLARLGLTRDEAKIEVLDEGKGGFLGIGAKNARVRVSRFISHDSVITKIVDRLVGSLDDAASVERVSQKSGRYECEIRAENIALLLGRRGRTLDAVQALANAIAARRLGERVHIVLDSGGFRAKRREVLLDMARDAAAEAVSSGEEIHLEPMTSHDRKIIHSALTENAEVTTESQDSGDRRHIVIMAKGAGGGHSRRRASGGRPSGDRPSGGRSASGRSSGNGASGSRHSDGRRSSSSPRSSGSSRSRDRRPRRQDAQVAPESAPGASPEPTQGDD
jgi:spoIIIJ-associated protein